MQRAPREERGTGSVGLAALHRAVSEDEAVLAWRCADGLD